MENRSKKINHNQIEAQLIIRDNRAEICLEGLELLKLETGQPRKSVMCTAGTLWLTQQGDPDDHLLAVGQSFTPNHRGTILVQGLPYGKARILSPA